jgi:hypothetical protein
LEVLTPLSELLIWLVDVLTPLNEELRSQKSVLIRGADALSTDPLVATAGVCEYVPVAQAASAEPVVAKLAPIPSVSAEAPRSRVERTADFFAIGSMIL